MPVREVGVYRDGITAGVIGATAVAVWFLIVDTVAGRPFFTPSVLGNALISVFDRPGSLPVENATALVGIYTVFHYIAFCIAGIVLAVFVYLARTTPSILGALFILFIAFQVGSLGLVTLLARATQLGTLAWYQVMAGNLVAAITMGVYFWRTHAELKGELRHALDDGED
jgi:hypothetical protein